VKRAIVLGCRDIGLGIIRDLAAKNIKVLAIPTEIYDFAHFSRFVCRRTEKISPDNEEAKLLGFLMTLGKDWEKALLLPTNDFSVAFIARNTETLGSRFLLATQRWETVGRLLDKSQLYREARKIGVPAPKVYFPDTIDDLARKKSDFIYPCILKPHETHKFFNVFRKKLFVINNFEELASKFEMVKRNDIEVMVSEIIPGGDECIYDYISYIDRSGDLAAELCLRKLRQHPPGFGMGRVTKTVPIVDDIRNQAVKLLGSCSYRGFSAAEFKFDKRDNLYKLIEINVRPVLQIRLFGAAGINFPYIAYTDHREGSRHFLQPYRTDIYWIDLIRDVHALLRWRKKEHLSFRDYISPYLKKKVYCTPFFDDPFPFVAKCLILAREMLRETQPSTRAHGN